MTGISKAMEPSFPNISNPGPSWKDHIGLPEPGQPANIPLVVREPGILSRARCRLLGLRGINFLFEANIQEMRLFVLAGLGRTEREGVGCGNGW